MTDEAKIEFSAKNTDNCPFREVDLRARLKMSTDANLKYRAAVHQVFTADETLHRAYLNAVPPLHSNRARS